MANYGKVNTLSGIDSAYIAGLIDGEGTVSLLRKHKQDNRQVVVSISNTDRPLINYLLEAIGAGKATSKRTYSERHTPSFMYAITNRHALDLLRQVAPHLGPTKPGEPSCSLPTTSGSPRAMADTPWV
ncbi:LAGLIDADG family homing endonuclease [Thiocapsa bogorovii]|uniref:LAGLIDADG family homing endonuclease n=1 Tax=Thiocapsa bogorovii TaxID=521689 RepID=UPI001E6561E3|nr:LAGLIDADG family homing endonuclease [Thiocapsa bogorovii]UHD16982.1 LAGLIDADG family homing endonuclease [Thiocapsa bogorovii]